MQKPTGPNVIEMIPQRNVDFVRENNMVVLLAPKFRNRILVRYIMPKMKQPHYPVLLDEFGTTVWDLIDGTRTVFEIGKMLKAQHGEKVEPVFDRLGLFVNMLAQRRFISLSMSGMTAE